jgi:hypothetical protein
LRRACLSIVRALVVLMLLASVAHADVWTKSCPIATHHGLCVRFGRAAPDACDQKRASWIAVPRSATLVKKALSQMTKHDADLARADLEFEEQIAERVPKLHFGRPGPSRRSSKRFNDWLERQNKRMADLAKRYRDLGAFARVAQLSQVMAQHLVTSQVPYDFTRGEFAKEKRDAFCGTLIELVEPLLARALEDFAACAGKEPANEWNAICVRELEAIDPETFPPMREKLPKPSVRGIEITLEGEPEQ